MLIKDDRELLQKTGEHALAFIFDHCDDVQLCAIAATLVQGMRELCETEKQMERELGVGMGSGAPINHRDADSMSPSVSRLSDTPRRSQQYVLNSLAEQTTPGATNAPQ